MLTWIAFTAGVAIALGAVRVLLTLRLPDDLNDCDLGDD